ARHVDVAGRRFNVAARLITACFADLNAAFAWATDAEQLDATLPEHAGPGCNSDAEHGPVLRMLNTAQGQSRALPYVLRPSMVLPCARSRSRVDRSAVAR